MDMIPQEPQKETPTQEPTEIPTQQFDSLMQYLQNPDVVNGKINIDPKNKSTYWMTSLLIAEENKNQPKQISSKQKRLTLSLHKLMESDIFPVFRIKIDMIVKKIETSNDLNEVEKSFTKLQKILFILESAETKKTNN